MFSYNHQTNFYCEICKVEISKVRFRQHKVCEKLDCRNAQRRAVKVKQQLEAPLDQEGKKEAGQAADAPAVMSATIIASELLEVPAVELNVVTVPATLVKPTSLPKNRRRDFIAHIKQVIREAVDTDYCGEFKTHDFAPSQRECDACYACGGDCCKDGGTRAYLQAEGVSEIMDCNPDLSPAQLFRKYLRSLPAQSYEMSCVFHGEKGCALDRQIRANLCNTFQCRELVELLGRSEDDLTIVAKDGNKFARVLHKGEMREFDNGE